uniref:Uncharacterized protein n=1 Tax=Anguilla anguilla TaxID=7936 RepID=A0A0E9RD66_ANGAN
MMPNRVWRSSSENSISAEEEYSTVKEFSVCFSELQLLSCSFIVDRSLISSLNK